MKGGASPGRAQLPKGEGAAEHTMTFRCSAEVREKLVSLAESWGCSLNVAVVRLIQGYSGASQDRKLREARRALKALKEALEEE